MQDIPVVRADRRRPISPETMTREPFATAFDHSAGRVASQAKANLQRALDSMARLRRTIDRRPSGLTVTSSLKTVPNKNR